MMMVTVSPVAVASAVVPYLLNDVAFPGTGLQRLEHAGRWRTVCDCDREAERGTKCRNHQQLLSHDVSFQTHFPAKPEKGGLSRVRALRMNRK